MTMITLEQLNDVLDARFTAFEARLDEIIDRKLDQKLDQKLEAKFEEKLTPVWKVLDALYSEQKNQGETLKDVQRRLGSLEIKVDEMQESLDVLARAEEKDAKATINHELRIRRLEKNSGIKSVPPKHLAAIKNPKGAY